ncbi:MAG: hypothetical protein CMB73_03800 [Euryarchaeota archaeon]|nr:hypothetical protein [Euryarchaeota archaeon]|tara:strand:- start:187 stop:750 length:564 start_codon:yes stop_codon:yes gene_type:complete
MKKLQINQDNLKIFTTIAGFFVLLSYVYGVWKAPDRTALWGGIEGGLLKFSVVFMFVAAAGYLIMWYSVLFQMSAEDFENLRWTFSQKSGSGINMLAVAFVLFLIPSMLWLESTSFHLRTDYSWTPILVIGILMLVSIGNVLFIMLGLTAHSDGNPQGLMIAIGGFMISVQCIINDLIIWSWKFPWQ